MAKNTKLTFMRLFVLILLIAPLFGLSQNDDNQKVPWRPPTGQDRFIFDFQTANFLETPDSLKINAYSPGMNAYIMYDYPFGQESIFSFGWGYGFSSFNVHHNGSFVEDSLKNTLFIPFESTYSYKKNKLSVNYLEVPLELRIRTNGLRQFKLTLGGKVGYAVNIHTKIKDDRGKFKEYQVPNLEKLRYGVYGAIGVGRVMLYGFYGLSELFEENRGPKMVPMTLGLRFNLL